MKKRRLIPVLLLKNGWLVQSKGFKRHQNLGDPVTAVMRLSQWASDEIIYLDISRDSKYDRMRSDLNAENRKTFVEIVRDVSSQTFMPLTIGGGLRNLKDIELRLRNGADKVALNTGIFLNDKFVEDAAKEFGSQCIVVSVDYRNEGNSWRVYSHYGQKGSSQDLETWCLKMADSGAGEILMNSIDRDGKRTGYDLEAVAKVSNSVAIPVIACGGVGEWSHFADALANTNVDGVAAANIFHYSDQSVFYAKKYLSDQNFDIRKPDLFETGG